MGQGIDGTGKWCWCKQVVVETMLLLLLKQSNVRWEYYTRVTYKGSTHSYNFVATTTKDASLDCGVLEISSCLRKEELSERTTTPF